MTFYWWSHWFWITLLCNLMFPHIVVVHTYPSQESTQIENNQNQNENENNNKKLVTKLYQTSTTLKWTTEIPNLVKSTTVGKIKLQSITNDDDDVNAAENPIKEDTLILNDKGDEQYYYDGDDDDETEDKTKKINLEQVEADLEKEDQKIFSQNQENKDSDVKRSAEIFNKTTTDTKSDLRSIDSTSTTISPVVEENKNNYTNYTDKQSSTNSTITSLNSTTTSTNNRNSDSATTTTTTTITNATTQLPQAPSTPKIVKAHPPGNLEWLNTVAAQLPPAHVTTDVSQDYPEDQHKIPFTLENVNKPEDLRREESEHRSRKSKGLSAEYKVNRYINYSSDSKNLLTRSAATTVNEYDSEESNISSEALSVQRAYFMDVGAISAICFTVFGIFCTVGTIGIVLYRRRFLNKPQALSEPDSSVYIDDSTMRVSDNSDEMYSLDNDSFLNSLEAMTIQNYWTDTVKHTKL